MLWDESLREIWLFVAILPLWILMGQIAEPKDSKPKRTLERATFAGGCFWCMEPLFDAIPGVAKTKVGYTGGDLPNPTYEEVCSGKTGHFEAVQLVYDPEKITFLELLEIFIHNIDPTDPDGQFYDRGPQYRTAIFYHDEAQKRAAEEFLRNLKARRLFREIYIQILPEAPFWPAEDYHQKFYSKNPMRYTMYKLGSGRQERLLKIWGEERGRRQ